MLQNKLPLWIIKVLLNSVKLRPSTYKQLEGYSYEEVIGKTTCLPSS